MRERLAAALEVRHVLTIRAGIQGLHAQMRRFLGEQGTD